MPADHQGESLSWFAEEFGVSRYTVRKRIADAGILPAGHHRGNPLYRVAALTPLLCKAVVDDWSRVDPDSLAPLESQQYWNGQKAKTQTAREQDALLAKRGLLLEYDDVSYGVAALLRTLREGLLVAGDVIEVEVGLTPKQRGALDQQIDLVLANLKTSVEQITVQAADDDLSDS